MSTSQFGGNIIDLRRVIFDLNEEVSAVGSESAYVENVWCEQMETRSMQYVIDHLTHHALQAHSTSVLPLLYSSEQFEYGISLGMTVNTRRLGGGTDSALAPHIDDVFTDEYWGYSEYADRIESIGRNAYARGAFSPATGPKDYPRPLRTFVDSISDAMFNEANHSAHFKAGLGIAHLAYRRYIEQMDIAFKKLFDE